MAHIELQFGGLSIDILIAFLGIFDVILAVLLVVVSMARLDRRYAARVRADYDRKSTLRGHSHDKDV